MSEITRPPGRRIGLRRSLATLTMALGVLAAPRAHAQVAEADALFARGRQLMAQDKLADACEALEASNRLDPRAGTLIWIGECRARNHQLASARTAYREALARVKDPRKWALATHKLAEIEDKLSYLLVVVADDHRLPGLAITRDGQPLEVETWNRGVPIDGGEYAITASAPGHATWTTTVTVPLELGRVRVEVPRLDDLAPPPPVPPGVPEPPREPRAGPPPGPAPAPRDAGSPRWTARRKLALGLIATSAAAWTTGAVLGVEARHRERDALALCPGSHITCKDARPANQLLDDGARRALGANLAFGAAAALTIGAGVLWLTGAPETASVVIAPIIAPGAAGVALSGRL
jgi:serine/threonine-protein kinase